MKKLTLFFALIALVLPSAAFGDDSDEKKIRLALGIDEMVDVEVPSPYSNVVLYSQQDQDPDDLQAMIQAMSDQQQQGGTTTQQVQKEADKPKSKLDGFGLGAGLVGVSVSGSRDRVEAAENDVNGIVRVTKERNQYGGIMLESHLFFQPRIPNEFCKADRDSDECRMARRLIRESGNQDLLRDWGIGPYVGVLSGEGDIIKALGLGIMWGHERKNKPGSSLNIGIGYIVEFQASVLADGFTRNEAAPLGPDGMPIPVTLTEKDLGGVMVTISFDF